jgi:predicted AAA+ superfamily ATPase
VEPAGSARKFGGSIRWLIDAGIICTCHNLSRPEAPLEGNSIGEQFKVYLNDTGLLVSMLGNDALKNVVNGNLGIYKGAIYENKVALILAQKGYGLYYFEYRSQIELDFLYEQEGEVGVIEVKSGDNTKSKSLKAAINNWGVEHGVRLSSRDYVHKGVIDDYPLYLLPFLI